MQALRTCPIMKRPRTIPSAPSTPPSPQIIQSKKTPTSRSFSSIKPRNILINPTPTTEQDPKWVPLNLSRSELYLPLTFPTGQTFRWKQTGPIQYTGVVGRSHLVSLKQLDNGDVGYHFHCTNSKAAASREEALVDFLNVGISLSEVWESFKASDSRFAELATHLEGARVLRQDPLECLIQFICSSNNNIKRITMMVDFVSSLGSYLGDVGGFKFYEFPSLERLAMVSEQELRAAGFGYRAKYIVGTVEALQSKPGGGTEWLAALRKVDLPEAIDALCSLPGVGPKVAACISLFSLDQHHAIPVDTHVWKPHGPRRFCVHLALKALDAEVKSEPFRVGSITVQRVFHDIATKYLLPELAGASLTPKLSSRVADAFVKTYGKYAGWAQTLLFIAELPSQKALLTSSLLNSTVEKSPKSKKRKQGGITEIPIG